MWEHFSHGADIGIRGRGPSRARAFAEAARALTAVVVDPERIDPRVAVQIRCTAPDDELLLIEWLNAIVYEMSTRRMVFARFEPHLEDHAVSAIIWGEPVDPARHQPVVEPKGATMTALRVARDADGWVAQTVVDV
jgi:SHS2 domain-containing protein